MSITGHGSLPASLPVKLRDQRPGIAARRRAEHQRGDVLALADMFAHGFHRLALADDDRRFDPRLVEDLADRGADDAFDAQALLFLERRLDAAPLDEILRLDHRQHLDPAVGLGGAAGGEAQRDARLRAVVDDDQIGANLCSLPPWLPKCCVKAAAERKRGRLIWSRT